MITEHLLYGAENAQTARSLAVLLNCSRRDITAAVERERREGQPIIASCDAANPGYYLAETAEEMQRYCNSLHHRAGEIYKTRRALLLTAQGLQAAEKDLREA